MITTQDINNIIGITESYMLPNELLYLLFSDRKNEIFARFLELQNDLSFDWFTDYFQENHSNREAMMQDFTPRELTEILPRLSSGYTRVLDVCAGTGGLSIGAWSVNHDATFVCEELSGRALPLLLFNMAIRNVNGYILHKDVLSGEIQAVYRLTKGEKYSDLERVDEVPELDGFDLVITNPPYSLKHEWQQVPSYCEGYGTPPTKAADYAFILYGLSRMAINGMLCAILPHGVLFRAQREAEIRQKLITENRLESVIGLPDKLFLNTDIPICIIVLSNGAENTLFIDASKEYLKEAKKNRLRAEDVAKITDTFRKKATVAKYSKLVNLAEIESNGYNCNIPRYVDTFEKKPLPDIGQVTEDLMQIDKEIRKTELERAKALDGVVGSEEDMALIRKYIRHLRKGGEKYEQITFNL